MTALRGTEVIPVPLADAVKELKTVPREYYALAEAFFG
jgi:6-phosphofructokinase 1